MRPTPLRIFAVLLLLVGGATISRAQYVMPASYTYNQAPTPDGGFSYPDPSLTKLIDGTTSLRFGDPSFNAAPLVGWFTSGGPSTTTITFRFDSAQTFSRIEIGTTRYDAAGVGALSSVTMGGSEFNSGITLANDSRQWLTFDGSFATTSVDGIEMFTITLNTGSPWVMLDEVRFTAVPEPASTAVVLCLAAGAMVFATGRVRRVLPRSAFPAEVQRSRAL